MKIRNIEGKEFILTGFDESTHWRRVNGEKEMELTLHKTKRNAPYFDDIGHMWTLIDGEDEYKVVTLVDRTVGDSYTRRIKLLFSFYHELRNIQRYESFSGSRTFNDIMTFILRNTGYTFNIVGTFYAREFENFGEDSVLSLFKTALERYGAEFTVSGKVISLRAKIGREINYQYRHKFNIDNLERQIDAIDFSTYGEGFGKDGLRVTYSSPLMARFGKLEAQQVRDERYTIRDSLHDRVKTNVDESLKISITFKFSDMRNNGYPRAKPQEGDNVLLFEDRLNISVRTRIVEIKEVKDSKGKVIDCDVTLSNFTNLKEQKTRFSKATKTIVDALDGKKPLPFEALSYTVQEYTRKLIDVESEVDISEIGMLAVDKNDPNRMVLFSAAGVGISEDGGRTFKTAITADGIATDLLTAGSINTGNIRIEGPSSFFYWDGDELKATSRTNAQKFVRITPGNIEIQGGGITIHREDGGHPTMINGILSYAFVVAATEPYFMEQGVEIYDYWWRGGAFKYNQELTCNSYAFVHQGRYLRISVGHIMGSESTSGSGSFHIRGFGPGAGINASGVFSNRLSDGEDRAYTTLTIDLGVPDGKLKTFYLKLRSVTYGTNAYLRNIRMWQEG